MGFWQWRGVQHISVQQRSSTKVGHPIPIPHSKVIIIHMFRAAFQYGVKMSEGRKTRRFGGGMTGKAKEKAKLNREWQQISAVSYRHNNSIIRWGTLQLMWYWYFFLLAVGKEKEDRQWRWIGFKTAEGGLAPHDIIHTHTVKIVSTT